MRKAGEAFIRFQTYHFQLLLLEVGGLELVKAQVWSQACVPQEKEGDMMWREEAEERVIRVLLGQKEWMWEAVVAYCLLRAMLVQTYFKFHEHWQGLEVVHEMILSVPILPLRNSHSKQWFFLCLLSRKISKWEVTSLVFKLNKYQTAENHNSYEILKILFKMRSRKWWGCTTGCNFLWMS